MSIDLKNLEGFDKVVAFHFIPEDDEVVIESTDEYIGNCNWVEKLFPGYIPSGKTDCYGYDKNLNEDTYGIHLKRK